MVKDLANCDAVEPLVRINELGEDKFIEGRCTNLSDEGGGIDLGFWYQSSIVSRVWASLCLDAVAPPAMTGYAGGALPRGRGGTAPHFVQLE